MAVLVGTFAALTACAQAGEPGTPAAMAQIDALIGDAPCHGDDECRVIGVGAKACGGPDAYRAWSVRLTDGKRLEVLVSSDAAARRAAMERLGMASDCAIVPVPAAACAARAKPGAPGRCVLQPAGAAVR